ncbi:hypothetical protein JCM10908_006341 [Rhodotorula pacifica]|uniref:Dabb family protein n=1 Tax=Rhodotorula pacifica TaxID=1495444 RepID=UPI003181531E
MVTQHLVAFHFKDSASEQDKKHVAAEIYKLKDRCKLQSGETYVTITGGKNHSTEGFNKNLEHGYILTFPSKKERDYYNDHDQAHLDFKKVALEFVDDLLILDFDDDAF